MFVHRRRNGQVGYRAQTSEVEGTVMRGTVFTHQSCAVEAEHDVQAQQCHVVDDVVERPLSKGAVDVAEGDEPLLRHTS